MQSRTRVTPVSDGLAIIGPSFISSSLVLAFLVNGVRSPEKMTASILLAGENMSCGVYGRLTESPSKYFLVEITLGRTLCVTQLKPFSTNEKLEL